MPKAPDGPDDSVAGLMIHHITLYGEGVAVLRLNGPRDLESLHEAK